MHDLIIIGSGPAGFTAAIYALRAKLDTLMLEKTGPGGQIALSDVIENYPGFEEISGMDLMEKFENHAKKFGLVTELAEVTGLSDAGSHKIIETATGKHEAKAVIIASGAKPRKLGIPGEKEYTGRGVSYCATCDGFFFRGKDVVLVGGGDTAVKEAQFLTKLVNKVYLVHRRDALRAEKILQEKVLSNPKIEFVWNSAATEIRGDGTVSAVGVKHLPTGEAREIPIQGAFIFVGIVPNTEFADVDKDDGGFIITDARGATSMPGVFAAGDCRVTPLRQVATAVGDAAIAAASAEDYIAGLA